MRIRYWLLGLVFSIAGVANAAEIEPVSGVVTNVNSAKQTITIRDEASQRRRTYFVADGTRLSSKGQPIRLSQIKKGNTVSLRYRATDRGREIVSFQVPDLDDDAEIIPITIMGEQTLSGRVTGVRAGKRTITIRDDDTRERLTIKVPEGVSIRQAGVAIPLSDISRGDNIAVRYRVTEQGFILVSGRAPRTTDNVDSPMTALPKTAGTVFMYLFGALGLFSTAGLIRLQRRKA